MLSYNKMFNFDRSICAVISIHSTVILSLSPLFAAV